MAHVHIQMDGEAGLRQSLRSSQSSDAFSQLSRKEMSVAGHTLIVAVLSAARV
jgi:hypothetical protein